MEALSLQSPVTALSGVGAVRAKELAKAGIERIRELLLHFPRAYRSGRIYPVEDERLGLYSGFELKVSSGVGMFTLGGKRRALRFTATDPDGKKVVVVYPNQPYLRQHIHFGETSYYFGTLQKKNGVYYLFSPERKASPPDPQRLYPVYAPIGSVSSGQIEKMIRACLVSCIPQVEETLPPSVLAENSLLPRGDAIYHLHAPANPMVLEVAKDRFLFEELFCFCVQASLFARRRQVCRVKAFQKTDLSPFLDALPFSLTSAQSRVLEEIYRDLVGDDFVFPMSRLVQGDVGSGKTVVAAAAAYLTAKNGKSTLVMAPTEILARQHASSFQKMFANTGIPVLCLTGSTPKKERDEIYRITCGTEPYILVGTHALTESGTLCQNVALSITDEQHRFGVRQRNVLGEKGGSVHSLVMSATPIPRTLAMFLFEKSKISVIDCLPPGRQPVKTLYVGEDKIQRVYAFLREKIKLGQQAYVVCPLIEEGELSLHSAQEEYQEIRSALPEVKSGLLHGKMKPAQKNELMDSFKSGELSLLVSTTVIEVGVDVPRATVMVIRNAERFGLSQLHQLRGRVGRGSEESFCILVSSFEGKKARERLKKLCDCHDGFELAQFDLQTRGPGEFFGTRQSGSDRAGWFDRVSMELLHRVSECADRFTQEAAPEELSPYAATAKLN